MRELLPSRRLCVRLNENRFKEWLRAERNGGRNPKPVQCGRERIPAVARIKRVLRDLARLDDVELRRVVSIFRHPIEQALRDLHSADEADP